MESDRRNYTLPLMANSIRARRAISIETGEMISMNTVEYQAIHINLEERKI